LGGPRYAKEWVTRSAPGGLAPGRGHVFRLGGGGRGPPGRIPGAFLVATRLNPLGPEVGVKKKRGASAGGGKGRFLLGGDECVTKRRGKKHTLSIGSRKQPIPEKTKQKKRDGTPADFPGGERGPAPHHR